MVSMTETDGLFALEHGERVPIARVHVDVELAHLDYPLDYSIPAELDHAIQPGVLVEVRLAGKKYTGWVIERGEAIESYRSLQPIVSVLSARPILSMGTYELARLLARKHISTVPRLLAMAIPGRHVGTEKTFFRSLTASDPKASSLPRSREQRADTSVWQTHEFGVGFLEALEDGRGPRAVWTAVPFSRDQQLTAVLQTVSSSGRQSIVVFPTQAQAQAFYDSLTQTFPEAKICLYSSDMAPAQRYETYLRSMLGEYDLVIGTRSAIWLPLPDLALLVIWDDGDDRLREQRSPNIDALDIAVARVHRESCALLLGSYSRSVKAQALVRSGWAVSLLAHRDVRHGQMPRIRPRDEHDREREGASAFNQVSGQTQQRIRKALETGSVLIHVPLSGFVPRISCQRCRNLARCIACNGQLSVNAQQHVTCTWCGRDVTQWVCPFCGNHKVRAIRIGSELTAERLGRAFPRIPLIHSNAQHPVTEVLDRRSRLVIATPGSEPPTEGGYELVVVLDPQAIASRPELWAPEEALRRWMNAFSLLSPRGEGIIDGSVEPLLAQSLIRWDPTVLVEHLLHERFELSFFPAATIVALRGESHDVHAVVARLSAEVLGTHVTSPADEDSPEQVRTLIRASKEDTPTLLEALARVQQERSSRKLPVIKMVVNPPELF